MVLNFNLDFPAILVAAVAYFLMGGLNYSPLLFGAKWMDLNGYTAEQLKADPSKVPYLVAFLAAVANCFVLAEVLDYTQIQTLPQSLGVAVFLWFGFYLAGRAPESFFGKRPRALLVVDACYPLLGNLAAATVLHYWPS